MDGAGAGGPRVLQIRFISSATAQGFSGRSSASVATQAGYQRRAVIRDHLPDRAYLESCLRGAAAPFPPREGFGSEYGCRACPVGCVSALQDDVQQRLDRLSGSAQEPRVHGTKSVRCSGSPFRVGLIGTSAAVRQGRSGHHCC